MYVIRDMRMVNYSHITLGAIVYPEIGISPTITHKKLKPLHLFGKFTE